MRCPGTDENNRRSVGERKAGILQFAEDLENAKVLRIINYGQNREHEKHKETNQDFQGSPFSASIQSLIRHYLQHLHGRYFGASCFHSNLLSLAVMKSTGNVNTIPELNFQ